MNRLRVWEFEEFEEQRRDWSHKTFGGKLRRGPVGPLKHLKLEADEAISDPTNLEEYADLMFLVLDATDRAGYGLPELMSALWFKLAKNKARKWPVPGAGDEPVEHERPSREPAPIRWPVKGGLEDQLKKFQDAYGKKIQYGPPPPLDPIVGPKPWFRLW